MTPKRLIADNGLPHFGIFDDAVPRINVADYRALTPLERPLSGFKRRMAHKQFEYLGVIADGLIFGCAMANLGYATAVFVYAFDTRSGKMQSQSIRVPFGFGVYNSDSPISGQSTFKSGKNKVRFWYDDHPRRKGLTVELSNGVSAQIEFNEHDANFQPMSLCTQAGRRGWVYAHKVAAVPVIGKIKCEFGEFDLAEINACGHHDFSSGFMRRETFWNWACISGKLDDNRLVGLNVSSGVNETSYSENCAWLEGRLFPLGQARFGYNWDDTLQPWKVTTACGGVSLEFQPAGAHTERLDAGLVKSNFKQIFGRFNGQIVCGDETLVIKDLYGFVEDQYAKW
jgi:hypothetical protein